MTNIFTAPVASAQTPTTNALPNSAGATKGDSGSGGTGKTALNSDFETFLKMLTVQAQNQDPLNPIDSTEYAAQLAAFSSVEQQVLTNDLLSGLDNRFGNLGMAQMAHWVGMEARVRAPAEFSGTPIEVIPKFENQADAATLVVRNSEGVIVQRLAVDPAAEALSWSGQDNNGQDLPQGLYSFAIESFAAGELLKSNPAQVYTRIEEIQNVGGAVSLVLAGGTKIDTSEVSALREL